MLNKSSYISKAYRPDVKGSQMDEHHVNRFVLDCSDSVEEQWVRAICFGPRKDNVLIQLEHLFDHPDDVLTLYYEDMLSRWFYVCDAGDIYFVYQKNKSCAVIVRTDCVYMRGCMITPDSKYWTIMGDFYNVMSLWKGRVMCNPAAQMSNESKLFQLNNSLLTASKPHQTIKIGTSFVIKGQAQRKKLDQTRHHVVKSLSGVRSIVVDRSEYEHWDVRALDHLPVLFQEKITGVDLRFHVLENQLYGKQSQCKDSVDYRYDSHFFELLDIREINSSIAAFCQAVGALENNNLMGIDFIQSGDSYYVLEANPCPGWSAYHPYNGIDYDEFLTHLMNFLLYD